jgi:hypothetical protein
MSNSIEVVNKTRFPLSEIEQWKILLFLPGNTGDREDFRHYIDVAAGDKPLDKAEWLRERYNAARVVGVPVCPSLVRPIPEWAEIEERLRFVC